MKYFLDTNMCVYYLKGLGSQLKANLLSRIPEEIKIPVITKAELLLGVEKSMKRDENREKVIEFLFPFEIVPFTDSDIPVFADIRSTLEKRGEIIGPYDLILASIVLSHEGTLVTHNTKGFSRIDNLRIEDWSE